MTCTALLDANVLYPAPMRDLLLQLAVSDIFRARWTADIHREWQDALLRNEPHRERAALDRTRQLMDAHVRDCLVAGYERLIPGLELPDPDDRHVLAAAIVGRCDVIITQNVGDFPEAILKSYGIGAQHPDEFLMDLLSFDVAIFCAAVARVRRRLVRPPYSVDEYLGILTRQGLVGTVAELRRFAASL